MTTSGSRVFASLALAVVVAAGLLLSGKFERDTRSRVEIMHRAAPTDREERAQLQARARATRYDPTAYALALQEDATRHALRPVSVERLRQPNTHAVELIDPIVLAPGKTWSSEHVRITARVQKIRYEQHGATISARHTLAVVHNLSATPIAYLVRLRSAERGHCEVRGARMHNAMALRPGEQAEIAVCGGTGKIRIEHLEILELTELGYVYVSRIPPAAVGHDDVTVSAHRPLIKVRTCETLDTQTLADQIADGVVRWVDVVDFHSRHDCDTWGFFPEYRHRTEPFARLPVIPPQDAAMPHDGLF